jgi:putative transcriptional regulator
MQQILQEASVSFIFTEEDFKMGKNSVSNNIRTLRFHKNEMTQQQLAENADVSRQTIVAIEKGNYSPSLELAFRIAGVFNVPLEEVFSYEPDDEIKGELK